MIETKTAFINEQAGPEAVKGTAIRGLHDRYLTEEKQLLGQFPPFVGDAGARY